MAKPEHIRWVALAVLLTGLVVVIGGLPGTGTTGWPATVVAPGAALAASGVAALAAMHATIAWSEQRRRDIDRSERAHREGVYEQLITHMTGVLEDRSPHSDADTRAKVALWASEPTMVALAAWQTAQHAAATQSGGDASTDNRNRLWDSYYAVVTAIRQDLGLEETPPADVVLRMIFRHYQAPR